MKKNSGLLLAAVVIVILCVAVVIFTGHSGKTETEKDTVSKAGKNGDSTIISEGEALLIPVNSVTTEAYFFPVEVDGTQMEIPYDFLAASKVIFANWTKTTNNIG